VCEEEARESVGRIPPNRHSSSDTRRRPPVVNALTTAFNVAESATTSDTCDTRKPAVKVRPSAARQPHGALVLQHAQTVHICSTPHVKYLDVDDAARGGCCQVSEELVDVSDVGAAA
jgi:hypothetical protein